MFGSYYLNIRPQFYYCYVSFHKQIDTVAKRGSMLSKMYTHKDKRKNWHLTAFTNTPKGTDIFAKIHRPTKRQAVLNSLFIRNITDVLSTGEIAAEVMGKGVEITEIKVTRDYLLANVYWQLPPSQYNNADEVQYLLRMSQGKIRAELISRNVLGRVPHINFVRDDTNIKIAAFEESLSRADFGPDKNLPVIPNDEFTKSIFSFKSKMEPSQKENVAKSQTFDPFKNTIAETNIAPVKPADMKSNVFGIDHEALMKTVVLYKKRAKKPPEKTAVITGAELNSGDLFSKIPGTSFQNDGNRNALLKQFIIDRKKLMNNNRKLESDTEETLDDIDVTEFDSGNEDIDCDDFINEDCNEKI